MSEKLNLNKKLDEKDLKIIGALKENARLSTYEIARKTGLPPTTVYNRMKQLDESHVIKKYTVEVDPKAVGKNLTAYIAVRLASIELRASEMGREEFLHKLRSIPGVEELNYITGRFDILLKVCVKDVDELNEILVTHLKGMKGVQYSETMLVLYTT